MNNLPFAMSEAIRAAYQRSEDDEAMEPICLVDGNGQPIGRIRNGDHVIFFDIRGEREIELTESFTDPNFTHFPVKQGLRTHWATMIEYDPKLDARVAFPPLSQIKNTLAEVVTCSSRKVCKISETEKAIHVTFFMNGKRQSLFPGESHVAIESRKDIEHYDDCPEMMAKEVADATIERLAGEDELIITNFANIDVLGHIENEAAILKAVNTVDTQVGRVLEMAKKMGVTALITSDHGTVEKWLYPEGAIDTGHTNSPVHFIYIDPNTKNEISLRAGGSLSDVAPTVLQLLGVDQPKEMTGKSLIQNGAYIAKRVLMLVTDGWGHNDSDYGNLILKAETPVMDALKAICPNVLIQASGEAVGLPEGTVGNSESGHIHLGAGRVIPSDRVRIQQAMDDGSYYENEAFLRVMRGSKMDGTNLHLLGIISFFSSHGSIDYLIHLLRMAKKEGLENVFIHGLLGRRGERPESGARYTREVEEEAVRLGVGQFVSIIGRHWALDREFNWDRIEKTYRWLVYGDGNHVKV
jgi:2,3-bisphosphoglycerate-independent phosphoglycerate mutase